MSRLLIKRLDDGDRAVIENFTPGLRLYWHTWGPMNRVIATDTTVMRATSVLLTQIPLPVGRKTLELEFEKAWLFLWPNSYGLAWIASLNYEPETIGHQGEEVR